VTPGQAIDETFAALGDPTRAAILRRLSRGPASVTELAESFAMSLRGVLKHVQVLEDAGVVHTVKTGRVRRCEIVREPIEDAARWIEQLRRLWERRLDRIDRYAQTQEER